VDGRHVDRDGGLQAVLFDMDGLLIDSERIWLEVETEVMAWLGVGWGPEHQEHLVGGSLHRTAAYMLGLAEPGVASRVSLGEIGRRLLDGMAARLREQVPMQPGAKELLTEVQAAGLPSALVSSTHRQVMEHALDGIGREFFTVTIAGDEVADTKPHPEPYLTAVRLLGVTARCCVVLEDSPNGIASAEAAGCVAVAVPSVIPIPAVDGRLVVESLCDLDLSRLAGLVAA
jgi:HAD superfamily hydrolase (TIGR01509 family)